MAKIRSLRLHTRSLWSVWYHYYNASRRFEWVCVQILALFLAKIMPTLAIFNTLWGHFNDICWNIAKLVFGMQKDTAYKSRKTYFLMFVNEMYLVAAIRKSSDFAAKFFFKYNVRHEHPRRHEDTKTSLCVLKVSLRCLRLDWAL